MSTQTPREPIFETEVREVVRAARDLERRDGRWHTQHEIALHLGWLTPEQNQLLSRPVDEVFAADGDEWMYVLYIAAAQACGALVSKEDWRDGRYRSLLHTATEGGSS